MAKIWNERVGVAAKALDDGLVAQFKAQGVFHARLIKQDHRLCVHQGQASVLPAGDQLLRQRLGQRVLRKGVGRVAVDVALELVEHQDLGQAPLWRGAQGIQLRLRRRLQRGPEAGAYGIVQGGVFGEVVLGVRLLNQSCWRYVG